MSAARLAAVLLAIAPRLASAQSDSGAPWPAGADGIAAPPAMAADAAPPAVAAPAAAPAPAPAPAAPPAPSAAPDASRSGLYLGLSLGTGRGNVSAGGTTTSLDDLVPGASPTTLALMLRFGWASGNLLFGFQLNVVRSQWDVSGVSSAMQLAAFDLVTTLRDPGTGLYARVGVGPAQLSFDANGTSSSQTFSGAEGMIGAGITMGAFGVGLDYLRQTYGKDAPIDGADQFLATVSLDFE